MAVATLIIVAALLLPPQVFGQPAATLEIDAESWMGALSFDLRSELTDQIREIGLGRERSFRVLLSGAAGQGGIDIAQMLIFNRLPWSPGVDDIFDAQIRRVAEFADKSNRELEAFLTRWLSEFGKDSSVPSSVTAALEVLAKHGTEATSQNLQKLAAASSGSELAGVMQAAAEAIRERSLTTPH